MATLPPSPFIDPEQDDDEQDDDEHRFVPDEPAMFEAIRDPADRWPYTEWPVWAPEDPPPKFLDDPSPEFIRAIHRDLAEIIENSARG